MPPPVLQPSSGTSDLRWSVDVLQGGAGALHTTAVLPERLVRVHRVDRPAIVLGSTQRVGDLAGTRDPDVEVVSRRSGGGAVWLAPGAQVWLDVVLPAADPLWDEDVGRAAHWLGAVWATVLGGDAEVWRGPMLGAQRARVACFAGIGPGEVLLGDRKVVGISQRRTASCARFQCVVYLRWDPEPLLRALGATGAGVRTPLRAGVTAIGAVARDATSEDVVARFLAALP